MQQAGSYGGYDGYDSYSGYGGYGGHGVYGSYGGYGGVCPVTPAGGCGFVLFLGFSAHLQLHASHNWLLQPRPRGCRQQSLELPMRQRQRHVTQVHGRGSAGRAVEAERPERQGRRGIAAAQVAEAIVDGHVARGPQARQVQVSEVDGGITPAECQASDAAG